MWGRAVFGEGMALLFGVGESAQLGENNLWYLHIDIIDEVCYNLLQSRRYSSEAILAFQC